jgi:hypothetical protein
MSTGVPVDLGFLAGDEALTQEIEEQFLLLGIVLDIAGGELATPVDTQPDRLQLLAHRGDVGVGPALGVDLVLHGGVLGRQAEGIPAHRMQHVATHRTHIARQYVAHGIVAHVAHVDAPRGVGEHLEHVVGLAAIVVFDLEGLVVLPGLLPAWLFDTRIVALGRSTSHFGKSLKPRITLRSLGFLATGPSSEFR